MISDLDKFFTAIKNIKDVQLTVHYDENDTVMTEEIFNKIAWANGKTSDDTAIETKTNPHSEITWTKVKEEMDKL
jgi:ribosomal protein S24E